MNTHRNSVAEFLDTPAAREYLAVHLFDKTNDLARLFSYGDAHTSSSDIVRWRHHYLDDASIGDRQNMTVFDSEAEVLKRMCNLANGDRLVYLANAETYRSFSVPSEVTRYLRHRPGSKKRWTLEQDILLLERFRHIEDLSLRDRNRLRILRKVLDTDLFLMRRNTQDAIAQGIRGSHPDGTKMLEPEIETPVKDPELKWNATTTRATVTTEGATGTSTEPQATVKFVFPTPYGAATLNLPAMVFFGDSDISNDLKSLSQKILDLAGKYAGDDD